MPRRPADVRYPRHAYIISGRQGLGRDGPIVFEAIKPSEGFRLCGEAPPDLVAARVVRPGKGDGDGLAGILVGAPGR